MIGVSRPFRFMRSMAWGDSSLGVLTGVALVREEHSKGPTPQAAMSLVNRRRPVTPLDAYPAVVRGSGDQASLPRGHPGLFRKAGVGALEHRSAWPSASSPCRKLAIL